MTVDVGETESRSIDMESTYKAITKEVFIKRLSEGFYDSAGGARRAIGKAQGISKTDKETLRELVTKKFGDGTPKANKSAAKAAKAPKVKAAKRGRKPKAVVVEASAPKKRGRPRKNPLPEESPAAKASVAQSNKQSAAVQLVDHVIHVARGAIQATKEAKDAYPDVNTSGVQIAVDVIAKATRALDSLVAPVLKLKNTANGDSSKKETPEEELLRRTAPASLAGPTS